MLVASTPFFFVLLLRVVHSTSDLKCPTRVARKVVLNGASCSLSLSLTVVMTFSSRNPSLTVLHGVTYGCDRLLRSLFPQNSTSLNRLTNDVLQRCGNDSLGGGLRSGTEGNKRWKAAFCCYDDEIEEPPTHCSSWLRILVKTTTKGTTTAASGIHTKPKTTRTSTNNATTEKNGEDGGPIWWWWILFLILVLIILVVLSIGIVFFIRKRRKQAKRETGEKDAEQEMNVPAETNDQKEDGSDYDKKSSEDRAKIEEAMETSSGEDAVEKGSAEEAMKSFGEEATSSEEAMGMRLAGKETTLARGVDEAVEVQPDL